MGPKSKPKINDAPGRLLHNWQKEPHWFVSLPAAVPSLNALDQMFFRWCRSSPIIYLLTPLLNYYMSTKDCLSYKTVYSLYKPLSVKRYHVKTRVLFILCLLYIMQNSPPPRMKFIHAKKVQKI
ncbi:hypothetical protein CLIB1423_41S00254 [[Candida] railenensis]|uniref:Uncharacterized protein n=1 Tax=[Candida] railenensis TaxID=45579 RepID=A0A9P0QVQ9_9ASCO|nr:hypothetical protein CLIB1423_41S00254 [[Candida] railenensis]